MTPPKTMKEVQVLSGRLTTINRFIPRIADRCASFFATLKNASKFAWDDKCNKAFEELKQFLVTPHVLVSPKLNEDFFFYIAISTKEVSVVLVLYTRKMLIGAKTRYLTIKKMAYAVVCAARKLRLYFHAHTELTPSSRPAERSYSYTPPGSPTRAKALGPYKKR
ncbi:hypothetical protein LINPERPRIM_LOCUS5353 [Linum perenne]